ncbi:hypothetical protein SAMN04488026_10523 [Aliiruegeria lutimaris]|uniref:Uncharacterized protein n=2 Tax=Aliiruegeria lutimaris TaxID=571298 RepID=A0A1G9EEA1_9RHOB|nr:hypothetical protein SAMN04488026_10523 [Aliiruegeria lutimaris]
MADTHGSEGAPHLPFYMTAPGDTDVLYVVVVVFVILLILGLGLFYFKLHALPEQMAHQRGRTHMQIVAILALLALFTHNNLFWIAALLLASIEFPEYERYFETISRSLEKIANRDQKEAESAAAVDVGESSGSDSMAREG